MTNENGHLFRTVTLGLKRVALALAGPAAITLGSACSVGSDAPPGDYAGASNATGGGTGSTGGAGGTDPGGGSTIGTSFVLRPEFDGACTRANTIDVNLGNAADKFVRAAYCQINGTEPDAGTVSDWSNKLMTVSYVRRIDVVWSLCKAANRNCSLSYSDPWTQQSDLSTPCMRSGTRDVGAVLMFFNDCPGGVNCTMDWANTHASGMSQVSPLLAEAPSPSGYYTPKNPGFWRRELSDAAYAGVQFFLLNTYGPDLSAMVDPLAQLSKALADTNNVVKIGMFDDTSSWGSSGAFASIPSFDDPQAAAKTIYEAKWKRFFQGVPRDAWYLFNGRPMIYFYNAGRLQPQNKAAAVISAMRGLFQADFGVSPFVAVDEAFFGDPDMEATADARFNWDTFRTGVISKQTLNGVELSAFMPKWDSLGRDHRGQVATATDRLQKDDSLLKQRLEEAKSSQLAVIATWNDMGEGTGITRNYDYYAGGQWLEPDTFLKDIRATQCSN